MIINALIFDSLKLNRYKKSLMNRGSFHPLTGNDEAGNTLKSELFGFWTKLKR